MMSIVLPAYNAAGSLPRAVDSLRAQTFSDWELLLVDDGSTDDTARIVKQFAASDPRIHLLERPHRGIVSALNDGLAQARGTLLARMDADDFAPPERLSRQVAFLQEHPHIGLVSCLVEFGGDRVRSAGFAAHVDWINGLVHPKDIALNRFVEAPLAHPSVVFRRELVARWGGYRNGDFPEDYELWLRWMDAGVEMAKVPLPLLTWYDSAARLSRSDPRYSPDAFYRCKAIYLARWLRRSVPGRPLYLWGAGRLTRRRIEYLLAEGIAIAGYVDIDPRKVGRVYQARRVISPSSLPPADDCVVLGYVAKRGARDLIRSQLVAKGFVEGINFLMAA